MKPLVVRTGDITERGLMLKEIIQPEQLDMEADGVRLSGPVRVESEVVVSGDEVKASVKVNAAIQLTCSRCLREVDRDFSGEYVFFQHRAGEKYFDIFSLLRGEMMLEYPLKCMFIRGMQ